MTQKFGQSFGFMMYVVQAQDLDTVLRKTQDAARALQGEVDHGPLASFQSIASFLPPPSQQMEILARLRAGRNDVFSGERIAATLHRALAANGFRPDAYDPFLRLFDQALAPPGPVGPGDIHDERLAALLRRFLEADGRRLHLGDLPLSQGGLLAPPGAARAGDPGRPAGGDPDRRQPAVVRPARRGRARTPPARRCSASSSSTRCSRSPTARRSGGRSSSSPSWRAPPACWG